MRRTWRRGGAATRRDGDHIGEGQTMKAEAYPPIRDLSDIEALEQQPLEHYLQTTNTYDAIRQGAAIDPERVAIYHLSEGSADEEPLAITYRELVQRIHQAANLFHHFGIGPGDVVAFLLPLLPQSYYVLWGGEAAGIVCSVNPMLEPAQILEILRAADAKVLVTLGPLPGSDIWEKVDAIRGDLPGLKATFQVLGPGDEARGVYSFDALLGDFPAGSRLTTSPATSTLAVPRARPSWPSTRTSGKPTRPGPWALSGAGPSRTICWPGCPCSTSVAWWSAPWCPSPRA
jgi:acyl-CoA synthetase (AMP-forming)/AMP-acid ligase II